jgi:AAA+ ATPase superfamily predicted ATPase
LPKDKICAYGILGGMPAYLNRFHPNLTLKENVLNELLSVQSYLFDEVNFLLRMELRDTKTYASLLHAIADGCTRLNEIAQRVGLDSTTANKYLMILRELALVRREISLTERAPQKSKKGVYMIADNYVNFWFRFVLPHISLIESGQSEWVYERMLAPHLSTYMGLMFEDVCRQYVKRYWDEKLKIAPKQVGRHWDKDFDIDVLTENIDESHFFGECKWWDGPVGENVLDNLIANAKKVPSQFQRDARYLLFSLGGFTDALKSRAERESVFLISAAELF